MAGFNSNWKVRFFLYANKKKVFSFRKSGYTNQELTEDLLVKKILYCSEYLESLNIVDAGLSHNRGIYCIQILLNAAMCFCPRKNIVGTIFCKSVLCATEVFKIKDITC